MLEFAIRYRVAIDAMTAAWEFNLHKYELASAEWNIAMELQDVLKASNIPLSYFSLLTSFCLDFQRCDFIFLAWHPQPGHCHPRHGPH